MSTRALIEASGCSVRASLSHFFVIFLRRISSNLIYVCRGYCDMKAACFRACASEGVLDVRRTPRQ